VSLFTAHFDNQSIARCDHQVLAQMQRGERRFSLRCIGEFFTLVRCGHEVGWNILTLPKGSAAKDLKR
jgi:hypothetical protein